MKVYVATKFELKDRAREVMFELANAGHQITYDWTVDGPPTQQAALADVLGVMQADALVCVFEEDVTYKGALVEFGIAIARGIPIYVLGHALDDHLLFLLHPLVRRGMPEGAYSGSKP